MTLDLVDDMQPDLKLLPENASVSDTKNHRGRARMNLSVEQLFHSIVRPDPRLMEFNREERFARHYFCAPQAS